jgi:hypothetical protein
LQRQAVLDRHDLGTPPATELEFLNYYNARRERIRQRMIELLSRTTEVENVVPASPA